MNYFLVLDMPFRYDIDLDELKKNYFQISRQKHPDRYVMQSPEIQEQMSKEYSEVNQAYETLRDPNRRLQYLMQQAEIIGDEEYKLDPEFLMEMLDLSEGLMMDDEEAAMRISQWQDELRQGVTDILSAEDWSELDDSQKERLREFYYKNKYIQRLEEQK